MKKNNVAYKVKKMYGGSAWVNFFTRVRFITGSFVQIEGLVPKKGKILDLGCGYGILSNYLALSSPQRTIIGVDTDKKKISRANFGIKNVSLNIGDATKMKLKELDCIILHVVLHHLSSRGEQKKLISDCKSMLAKNGRLLIVEVDKKPFWKWSLGRIADLVLYKGDPIYYLYRVKMLPLLEKYFPENVRIEKLYNNPFSVIAYICEKR